MKGNAEGEERGAGAGVSFGRAFGEIHQTPGAYFSLSCRFNLILDRRFVRHFSSSGSSSQFPDDGRLLCVRFEQKFLLVFATVLSSAPALPQKLLFLGTPGGLE